MERTITQWKAKYLNGDFDLNIRQVQINAGWYDWFCKTTSLGAKTKKMGKIVSRIVNGGKVDLENWYVWFKNNCPFDGPLYDDFRFATINDGEVQMTIKIDCCWNKHKYSVYGRRTVGGEFEKEPLFECDNSRDLVKWLNTAW